MRDTLRTRLDDLRIDALSADRGSTWRTSTRRPVISIVVPALNEQESLPALIATLESLPCEQRTEVVLVDDGSDDATWSVMEAAAGRHPTWQAVRLSRRFGHQAALLAGMSVSRGDAVITLDADGQHPPSLIPEMIETWRGGAKVVQMIRAETGQTSWLKRATSRAFYRVFSTLSETPIRPAAADFRLLDRSVVDLILKSRGPTPFFRGLIPWLGCRTVEIVYEPASRHAGETKYSFRRMARLAVDGLMSFSIVPLRLGIWLGLSFASLAFVYLCYIAWIALFNDQAVSGWASTVGLVALLGGVQLICTGMLGEYLGRLYLNTLDRPRFVVDQLVRSRRDESDVLDRLTRQGETGSIDRLTHPVADRAEVVDISGDIRPVASDLATAT